MIRKFALSAGVLLIAGLGAGLGLRGCATNTGPDNDDAGVVTDAASPSDSSAAPIARDVPTALNRPATVGCYPDCPPDPPFVPRPDPETQRAGQ